MRPSVFIGVGAVIGSTLLGSGYLIGTHNTKSRCLSDLADNAVAGLHAHYFVLSRLQKGQEEDAKMVLAAQAEADLDKILNYGGLIDRPGHKEYRSILLREYRKFRKENPSLYQIPSYIAEENVDDWMKIEKKRQEFLDKNSAADGVEIGP